MRHVKFIPEFIFPTASLPQRSPRMKKRLAGFLLSAVCSCFYLPSPALASVDTPLLLHGQGISGDSGGSNCLILIPPKQPDGPFLPADQPTDVSILGDDIDMM